MRQPSPGGWGNEVPLPVKVAMQMGRNLTSWNDGIHWSERSGFWRGSPRRVLEIPQSPSRAHSPHLGHYTLCGEQVEAHPLYQGVPSYESIMDLDTGEQKVDDTLAVLQHPSIYKEGN